eukprot:6489141-Amphidinium_carterae.5
MTPNYVNPGGVDDESPSNLSWQQVLHDFCNRNFDIMILLHMCGCQWLGAGEMSGCQWLGAGKMSIT